MSLRDRWYTRNMYTIFTFSKGKTHRQHFIHYAYKYLGASPIVKTSDEDYNYKYLYVERRGGGKYVIRGANTTTYLSDTNIAEYNRDWAFTQVWEEFQNTSEICVNYENALKLKQDKQENYNTFYKGDFPNMEQVDKTFLVKEYYEVERKQLDKAHEEIIVDIKTGSKFGECATKFIKDLLKAFPESEQAIREYGQKNFLDFPITFITTEEKEKLDAEAEAYGKKYEELSAFCEKLSNLIKQADTFAERKELMIEYGIIQNKGKVKK